VAHRAGAYPGVKEEEESREKIKSIHLTLVARLFTLERDCEGLMRPME